MGCSVAHWGSVMSTAPCSEPAMLSSPSVLASDGIAEMAWSTGCVTGAAWGRWFHTISEVAGVSAKPRSLALLHETLETKETSTETLSENQILLEQLGATVLAWKKSARG